MEDRIIRGRRAIQELVGRSWPTIEGWMKEGAPIVMVDGHWETDKELLYQWRRRRITDARPEDAARM